LTRRQQRKRAGAARPRTDFQVTTGTIESVSAEIKTHRKDPGAHRNACEGLSGADLPAISRTVKQSELQIIISVGGAAAVHEPSLKSKGSLLCLSSYQDQTNNHET
jgi:hypothetical protein